ncbi:dephospho-CoA kinase [Ruminiclostridium cellulolyticum]|uniref:Dephospho-CoA kinase n=1 Tax=Ruminiclostridium cellulolyticum (strain ATCC 35319 / DSM 5812 / JCM 6584 / H10) TaxID=394503 RepID=B8I3Y6_RUMCH|nr:dephospho-CoA kinase [Ruminiclostridium cellulolyticum]ACL76419.1 dephospho-CoA kinase [Ruminiclostridium cellulolyticum H10]
MIQNRKSIVLGITGGIGSGKSTVSSILKELGAVVIDADVISREVVEPGKRALEELTQEFGKDILDDWGQLNRKKLAARVFNDENKLGILNSIVHKYVAQIIKENVEEQLLKQTKVIVIDAPIPIKNGFLDLCDEVWTVFALMEKRVDRVMKRNSMTYEEAVSRIRSQISDDEYLSIANTVINNNNDMSTLRKEVEGQFFRLLR